MTNLTTQSLVEYLNDRPGGVSSGEIESHFDVSRSTLIRRLKEAMRAGTITVTGKGPATRYFSADLLSALKAYFAKAHTERVVAPYREERLAPSPGLSDEATLKFKNIARHRLGKRELGKFLIDFACASSVLEGGTYSLLDTQALIEYGEKSPGKPLEDAFLVLNHKEAFEYLHDNMRLDSIYRVHDLLTSDHDLPELAESRHFLPANERGVVRDGAEVDIPVDAHPVSPALQGRQQADVTSDLQRSADPRRPAPDLLRRFRETGLHRVAAGVLRARRHPPCRALPRRGLHEIHRASPTSMATVHRNVAVSADNDQSLHLFLASQGGGRKWGYVPLHRPGAHLRNALGRCA
jgi:hypothetical protein